jgi:tetratricopeptide (TPR) repeat protein
MDFKFKPLLIMITLSIFAFQSDFCIALESAEYDLGQIPEKTLLFSKEKGIHELIMKRALDTKVEKDAFSVFYQKQYETSRQNLSDYNNASTEIQKSSELAFKKYGDISKKHPENACALVYKGMALYAMGDYKAALDEYTKSIDLDKYGCDGFAYYERSLVNIEMKKFDAAQKDVERAYEISPGNTLIHSTFAQIEVERENYDKAAEHLDKYFTLNAGKNETISPNTLSDCEKLTKRGYKIRGCENLTDEKNRCSFLSTSNILPSDIKPKSSNPPWEDNLPEAKQKEVYRLVFMAQKKIEEKSRRLSIESLSAKADLYSSEANTILKLNPDLEVALVAALRLYEIAIFFFPNTKTNFDAGVVLLKLSISYHYSKGLSIATDYFSKFIDLYPNGQDGWAYKMRAIAKLLLDDNREALKDLNSAIGKNPDNPYFYQDRAMVLTFMGSYNRASEDMGTFFEKSKNPLIKQLESTGEICSILIRNGQTPFGCDLNSNREMSKKAICYPEL